MNLHSRLVGELCAETEKIRADFALQSKMRAGDELSAFNRGREEGARAVYDMLARRERDLEREETRRCAIEAVRNP